MQWVDNSQDKPIKSWCENVEPTALQQAVNLANHPKVFRHVALMPDCHQGYGMPIGGVIACPDAVIPYAVGVDIGCGMCAVKTNVKIDELAKSQISNIVKILARMVPVGFDVHKALQSWGEFENDEVKRAGWNDLEVWNRAQRSLGTLGGGNHFMELQREDDGAVWLMVHSGSRNLGKIIADYYHKKALKHCEFVKVQLPDKQLSYLDTENVNGQNYLRDMTFALNFARENRMRLIKSFKEAFKQVKRNAEFEEMINIHHNYAAKERHFGRDVWVHRKGATAAHKGLIGIIPGSMGTSSYIVEGLGNEESFCSCSHGAGRKLGRNQACRQLNVSECLDAMGGVVFEGFNRISRGKRRGTYDLSEAPQVYKDIETVIDCQRDLINPIVKLFPIGVMKG